MSTVDAAGADVVGRGLTAAEADERRRRGEANTAVSGATRSYASILRTNVLSFFNIILFVIGVALLALGRYSAALISVGRSDAGARPCRRRPEEAECTPSRATRSSSTPPRSMRSAGTAR